MPKSTNVIGDITTVINNGPSSVTLANCIAPAGEIMDYIGLTHLLRDKAKYLDQLLGGNGVSDGIKSVTNAGDPSLTQINELIALLNGTGGPSTQALTDSNTIVSNGPTAATAAAAIAPAGEIMDYIGNTKQVVLIWEEIKVLATAAYNNTDNSTDGTNRGLLNGIVTVIV